MKKISIAIVAGLSLLLLSGNGSASSGSRKYVPKKQASFKKELAVILQDLEVELDIPYLKDFFMCVAKIESNFVPSAIRYESGGWKPDLFETNPYIDQPYLWQYSGGLFQLFPSTALSTNDGKAEDLDPRLVFHALYAVAFAVDLAYRLNKNYGAYTWIEVRLGWASLSILKEKPLKKSEEIQNRMLDAADKLGINPQFLYQHPNFSTYSKYQFVGLVNYLFDKYGVKK